MKSQPQDLFLTWPRAIPRDPQHHLPGHPAGPPIHTISLPPVLKACFCFSVGLRDRDMELDKQSFSPQSGEKPMRRLLFGGMQGISLSWP